MIPISWMRKLRLGRPAAGVGQGWEVNHSPLQPIAFCFPKPNLGREAWGNHGASVSFTENRRVYQQTHKVFKQGNEQPKHLVAAQPNTASQHLELEGVP